MFQNVFPRLLPVYAAHSSFFSFFLLLSMRTEAGLYLQNLLCHLSWGEIELKMKTMAVTVSIMQASCLSLACNQWKSSQCRLLEPSDPPDHQPKPASDKQKLSLGSTGYQWDLHGSVQLLHHGHLMPSEMAEDVPVLAFSCCFGRVPCAMPVSPQAWLGYPRKPTAYLFQTFLLSRRFCASRARGFYYVLARERCPV